MDIMEINEVIKFENGELSLDVRVSPSEDTVWLSLDQIAKLFDRNKSTISRHIKKLFDEGELDKDSTVAKFATVQNESERLVERKIEYYNLDVIISVGYRVKSKNGILFRKWVNNVLKQYLIKRYIINDRYFNNIDYITSVLDKYSKAGGVLPKSSSILEFLKVYQRGFKILDDFDHHKLSYPKGTKDTYIINYKECIQLIRDTVFVDKGDLFAIERDRSFESSLSVIYQSFGGVDLYPTIEDKASALLYFIVKNHSFIDGNKRIGATVFLYFLEMNHSLYKDNMLRISNETLATLTILVASSLPDEKDIMMKLIKTIIN